MPPSERRNTRASKAPERLGFEPGTSELSASASAPTAANIPLSFFETPDEDPSEDGYLSTHSKLGEKKPNTM